MGDGKKRGGGGGGGVFYVSTNVLCCNIKVKRPVVSVEPLRSGSFNFSVAATS